MCNGKQHFSLIFGHKWICLQRGPRFAFDNAEGEESTEPQTIPMSFFYDNLQCMCIGSRQLL